MDGLPGSGAKPVLATLFALVVAGGFALALLHGLGQGTALSGAASGGQDTTDTVVSGGASYAPYQSFIAGTSSSYQYGDQTSVLESVPNGQSTAQSSGTTSSGEVAQSPASDGEIEFSSDVSLTCPSPQSTAQSVVALAYSVGGYVAYQSTYGGSAFVVIRVPTADYQSVLTQVEAMGNTTSVVSTSVNAGVQYTDLNATLASLVTEQTSLLKLLNQSSAVNTTLAIESQLQGVNDQIDDVQSQILQTRSLIDFATVNATITKSALASPLVMTLTATPLNGTAPLSVTFDAVVKGGASPYVVNFNFGDGTSAEGDVLIHTFDAAGTYKVHVTVTDDNGTVASAEATVSVSAAASQYGVPDFPAVVLGLFVGVVEGIAEVAAVVLPLALVAALLLVPLRRRFRARRGTVRDSLPGQPSSS